MGMDMYTQKNMNMNNNDYHTEYKEYKKKNKFCQCFLQNGKRKGERCYKYNCFSHKNQTLEIFQKEKESIKLIGRRFPCRARIKKEIGYGYENCGRVNCKFHSIVSDILELPDAFFKAEEYHVQDVYKPHSTKDFIEMYEFSFKNIEYKTYKKKIVPFLKKTMNTFVDFLSLQKQKFFLFSCIFHLLDTPCFKKITIKHHKFKTVCLDRLEHCMNCPIDEDNIEYITYFQTIFTTDPDKKYITKKNNKKYNIIIFKLITKLFILYRKTLAYTYRPGGKLFLEAQERFYKNAEDY